MFRKMMLTAAIVAGCTGFVRAAALDDVRSGLQKLADSSGYSWKTTVEGANGAGETDGKTQKDGLTTVSITRGDNTYEVVMQGDKAAIKTEDGWKSTDELTAGGGGGGERMLVGLVRTFKTPVALAQEMSGRLQNVQKTDDGYTAELSEDAAKAALTMRRRPNAGGNGPTIANAKASYKVWVKDGIVTKMQSHFTGTVSFNGNDRDIDRTSTTEFTDIGSTTIKIPDQAKAKLTAAPTTQP
jgi:hypothetical protein